MNVVACPSCGSGSRADAAQCWLCAYPLVAVASAPAPAFTPITPSPPQRGLGWLVAVILAVLVMLAVGVELALFWPGLLIPYAVVLVPVVFVLGRVVYVQRLDFWESKSPAPIPAAPTSHNLGPRGDAPAAPKPSSGVASTVVTGLAVGLLGVALVVGVLMLLAIAAFIVVMVICFASMAVA